ncbi:hypothetical protein QOZ80_1BG0093690 [Eleusine coracana subsp. coracana]|nr:hypothetical protein QOZ80_1BG0093690 [Eleusine coracana subsp. coracana]
MAITAGPQPTLDHDDKDTTCPFVAIGDDRIYGMDMSRSGPGGDLEVLRLGGRCSGAGWSWSSVPSPPPFDPLYVKCYAVHPDERTIFYSLCSSKHMDPAYARDHLRYRDDTGATFSFDTETLEWAFRGYWRLPFDDGEAHYDAELDAWVGFDNNDAGDGRLCSCDVVPPATGDEDADRRAEAPPTKHCKDRLFRRKGRRRHGGGGLVYMGGTKFCVLECVTEKRRLTREEFRQVIKMDARPRLHLYVRTFSLKYSNKGRLRVATCGRRARCYCLPEGTPYYPYGDLMQTIRGLWL